LRAARVLAGFDNAEEVARRVGEMGFEVSRQRLYTYERGEFIPPLDLGLVLATVLDPPGGLEFFRPAFRADLWEKLQALARGHEVGPAAPESGKAGG
jgi:hypothetical protein